MDILYRPGDSRHRMPGMEFWDHRGVYHRGLQLIHSDERMHCAVFDTFEVNEAMPVSRWCHSRRQS
jgi:hypothetical protein